MWQQTLALNLQVDRRAAKSPRAVLSGPITIFAAGVASVKLLSSSSIWGAIGPLAFFAAGPASGEFFARWACMGSGQIPIRTIRTNSPPPRLRVTSVHLCRGRECHAAPATIGGTARRKLP